MFEAEGVPLAPSQSFQVHETGHISSGNDLRTCLLMIGEAIETHHAGDGLFGDGKCPPETTTLIRSGERNEIDPREVFEELTRLTEGVTDPLRTAPES